MAAREDEYSELERALEQIFPHGRVEMLPSESRGHAPAAKADIHAAAGDLHLWIELLGSTSNARLMDAVALLHPPQDELRPVIPVLAAPYFSPSKQELLRDGHTAFLDFVGNAWLVVPGVHVDRRGFRNPEVEQREQRDLFSDKASLVLRVLLNTHSPLGVRQIADMVSSRGDHVQLSPGYVSKVVKELERRGYAARRDGGIVLRHAKELLDDWVVSYRRRRNPVAWSYFIPAPSVESVMPRLADVFNSRNVDYVFAGHAGASLVDRHADFDVVDLYVKNPEDADAALSSLGARRVDRGGNVRVLRPYYRESAFFDAQMPRGPMRVASDMQLYLDLYDYPVRGREQAEHLYERRLRPMIERGDSL